jgi:hypothetical protein
MPAFILISYCFPITGMLASVLLLIRTKPKQLACCDAQFVLEPRKTPDPGASVQHKGDLHENY